MSRQFLLKLNTALCLSALILVTPQRSRAQVLQGTIDGNVTDPSQAAIGGATVSVTNQGTALNRETTTNSLGEYTLPTLPPGTYTLSVKATGFGPYSQTGIVVNVNEVNRVNVALAVGQVNQDVTVSAQAANLQTDKADVHTDLTTRSLTDLPTPLGRNYQLLLPVMVPGVATPSSGGSFAANPSRSVSVGYNGTSGWGNSTRIDGTSATDFNGTYPMYTPALEAIETVNVVTNSFDAEQGMASAAAINIQTKSGSNADPWLRLRVPLRPASEGLRVGRRPHPSGSQVHQQPDRCNLRRSHQKEQTVLLCQLGGDVRSYCNGPLLGSPHREYEGRHPKRVPDSDLRSADRQCERYRQDLVCRQHHSHVAHRSGHSGAAEAK